MSVEVASGTFTLPAAAGIASVVTGLSFQPKLVIFTTANVAADGFNSGGAAAKFGFGAAIGTATSEQFYGYFVANDNVTNTNKSYVNKRTRSGGTVTNAGAQFTEFDFDAFASDGFSIDVTAFNVSQRLWNWIAIGGTDFEANIVEVQSPGSTGSQAYTGAGFQPEALIAFTMGNNSLSIVANINRASVGFSDGTTTRSYGVHSDTSSNAESTESTALFSTPSGAGATQMAATLTSLDSDGFTLNWTNVVSSAYVWVICLRGGQYKVGTETAKTSTGTKATTGVGFQPIGLLLTTRCQTTTGILADAQLGVGLGAGATKRSAVWSGQRDGQATSIADCSQQQDQILTIATEGTPTLDAEADLDSFDSDGFTLDWTTADGTDYDFSYLAIGNVGGGGGGGNVGGAGMLLAMMDEAA